MREESRQLMMECAEEFDAVAYHSARVQSEKDEPKWIEHYCDIFASCIILPEKTVRMAARKIMQKHGIATMQFHANCREEQQFALDVLAGGVAEVFETSKEAAFYKLCDLKIIRGCRDFYEDLKAKYRN